MNSPKQTASQMLAAHLMAQLTALGCEQIFLAPGSRSQALAIAAAQLADAGRLKLTVRLDERSLGFQALGAAVASGRPVGVITTSGTAVANLHPAVLEAHHSGVPLILLTADRPHELRGVGANQTTNQVGIFSDAIRGCLDIAAADDSEIDELAAFAEQLAVDAWRLAVGTHEASELGSGPVQLNLGFREPLSSAEPNAAEVLGSLQTRAERLAPAAGSRDQGSTDIDLRIPTVIIAGSQALAGIAARLPGVPVIAEPSSGARHGDAGLLHYRTVLAEHPELVSQIRRVVVTGKPTLARQVLALLRLPEVEVLVIDSPHGHFDVAHNARQVSANFNVTGAAKPEWLEAFKAADAAAQAATARSLDLAAAPDRRSLIQAVYAATAATDSIVLGASRLIREAETWAPAGTARVWANRGLAGIDGTIATAIGFASGSAAGSVTRALMGDLTFLHDAGSLAQAPAEPAANLQIIVGNDSGGTIFESLEVSSQVESTLFDRIFRTPQTASIGELAKAYGWQYIAPKTQTELESALETSGRVVIEVAL